MNFSKFLNLTNIFLFSLFYKCIFLHSFSEECERHVRTIQDNQQSSTSSELLSNLRAEITSYKSLIQALQEEISSIKKKEINDISKGKDDEDLRMANNAREHVTRELRAIILANQHEIRGLREILDAQREGIFYIHRN